jgi:hypothetical protein
MGLLNYYFKDSLELFSKKSTEEIIGAITLSNEFDSTLLQNKSWQLQIPILKKAINGYDGSIFFEFSIPRMGKRVDTIIIINNIVFVIEFKVGESKFLQYHVEQVWDYALDLKNFHEPSHHVVMIPVLVATEAKSYSYSEITFTSHDDSLALPVLVGKDNLGDVINSVLIFYQEKSALNGESFAKGRYSPTPTIIEAAVSLYNSHTVEEITRSDATAKNLTQTTSAISDIITLAREKSKKVICFVTGVPGAGKTLVGLKVATTHLENQNGNTSVYLSGNGPLVAILQEALARDKISRESFKGKKITKREARQAVKSFIQNIHHYRDAYVVNSDPPYDHVAIFDEAQRAWTKEQTVKFMKIKKNQHDFDFSEPEFLISCLDRHPDWAVVVCLVGGGQEINTGEAGISEWLNAIFSKFSEWDVYISPNLKDSEYAFQTLLTTHPAFMLYFYNDTCGVCKVLWPRVEALVKEKFPRLS